LSSVTVFCFNPDGNLIVRRNFTSSEVSTKKATFALPKTAAGASVEFYAIANTPIADNIVTKTALLALTENTPISYNGTFTKVSSAARRPGGFVMTGAATKTIAASGTPTEVAVTLRRSVAKIAVQTTLGSGFSNRYLGKVRVNSAVLSRAASRGFLVGQTTPNPGAMTFSHTQATVEAASKFNNQFYTFENGNLAAGSRLLLTLNATYDRDGDFATTGDQAPVIYEIELSGGGAGQIVRNGYYRVQVTLDGLTGADVTATITVADWETPVTQAINLGA